MSVPSQGQNLSANQIVNISPFTAEILLLPVWKNTCPPYWNYTSGFNLDHFAVSVVLFCMRLPNFVQIGPPTAVIWRRIAFQDGGCQLCCIWFGVTGASNARVYEKIAIFDQSLALSPKWCKLKTYGRRIWTRTQAFEWCHFQWPWTTPTPVSRSHHYMSLNISETVRYTDIVSMEY